MGAAPSLALAREANQNIFRIQLKRKNHPPKFKTIMKKNLLVWAAGYASGRAAGRDLIISLEQGSSFVQQLQPGGLFLEIERERALFSRVLHRKTLEKTGATRPKSLESHNMAQFYNESSTCFQRKV